MKTKNQIQINMSIDDIKNAIIYFLYREQKISGIFDVKLNPHGAEIVVDLNETQVSP
jgi:hypothetical protein